MKEDLVSIRFQNSKNPKSAFDLLKLEELFVRESLDHNIEMLHRVDFFALLLIAEGHGRHTVDFIDYACDKGTILTIRKDQIHKFSRSNEVKGYLLLFKEEFVISYLEKLEAQKSLQLFNELLGNPKVQLSEPEFEDVYRIIGRIWEEYFDTMDDYSLGIIRSELHILITKLYRIKSKGNLVIKDKKYLMDFIAFQKLVEKYAKETTRVLYYADKMAVSTKTINNMVKATLGKTAKEFIDDVNVKQIKRLLINTSDSIKEIAYASGFEETSNFYKYFKRHVGMTPEQFRASF